MVEEEKKGEGEAEEEDEEEDEEIEEEFHVVGSGEDDVGVFRVENGSVYQVCTFLSFVVRE